MGSSASRSNNSDQAYHVLQVTPNSPGEKAGLQGFFDFITSANNLPLQQDDSTFVDILTSNVGNPVILGVYNANSNDVRQVTLTPSRDWGGTGLAGINVRMSNISKALSLVWHVLHVYPSGPASSAGIQSGEYIVGVPGLLFNNPDDFYNYVKMNLGKPITLYIYSPSSRTIRTASLTPDHNWGGRGYLGCDVAFGLNHQLDANSLNPPPNNQPTTQPQTSASHSPTQKHDHQHGESCDHDHQHGESCDHDHQSPKNESKHDHKHGESCDHNHTSPKQKHDHKHGDGSCNHDHHDSHDHKSHDHKHGESCDHQSPQLPKPHQHTSSCSHSHGTTQKHHHFEHKPRINEVPVNTLPPANPNHEPILPKPATADVAQIPLSPIKKQYPAIQQLYSPLRKPPTDYNATPLPNELFEEAFPTSP